MQHSPLPTFDVPMINAMPPVGERAFDVVGFTDFLLNQSLLNPPGLLHCDFHIDEGQWRVHSWTSRTRGPDEVIAVIPDKGRFRAILAHFAVRFLNHQIYGGFAEGFLMHRGVSHYFALYAANDQFRGYWVRLYTRRVIDRDGNPAVAFSSDEDGGISIPPCDR